MYNNPYKAYQKTQVTTASPEKILLLLYEGAIKFCKLAIVKMREKNISEKGKYISKALAIISELMNTLDHEVGGQLAADLENLYMFMMDKLIEGNMNNKVEDIEAVERLLVTLFQGWKDVVNNPRPDGIPSAQLQPDLHSMYQQASGQNGAPIPPKESQRPVPKIVVPPRKA